ncbi:hypothetical protein SAMN04487887_11723 [Enterococcus casseliflavus]|uniref:DUF7006 family protein n=1 Tax=Enterococcus casseliflavus TaxID=37734 RepID=UPI0008ECBA65|nr:hypothetical protein [Enterococcus casseliflavus]SFE57283.1 hypothetical protein SAMN04487887_11723 [Enterococcus casseliflavus]
MYISSIEDYTEHFKSVILKSDRKTRYFDKYVNKQFCLLTDLIEQISSENFWEIFPIILGIDAKLSILIEIIPIEDIESKEILKIVEKDYKTYSKELCGFDLSDKAPHSLIFNVL